VRRLTPAGEEIWAAPLGHGGVLCLTVVPASECRHGHHRASCTCAMPCSADETSALLLVSHLCRPPEEQCTCRPEQLVVTTMDGSVALFDAEAGTKVAALQPHRKYVIQAVCLQAAGETRVVTGSWVRTYTQIWMDNNAELPARMSLTAATRNVPR
jgi:hypothetical protein